jgi:hypothetical protein
MKKIIKDNKVAVLYSPGFGGGWYSWIGVEQCLFEPEIVELVLQREEIINEHYCSDNANVVSFEVALEKINNQIKNLAKLFYGEYLYVEGAENLQVAWIEVGTMFRISEYDGSESIHYEHDFKFIRA